MIYFSNPGQLDIVALQTMGMSSKDESHIGRFGTGLKYAIAIVLRNGGQITITSGADTYSFTTEPYEFRGKSFERVLLNGEPLGFTTNLGRDWEPWMAFREFYANALDEGGNVTDQPTGADTCIAIDLPAFESVFYELENYFISREEEPLATSDDVEIYSGRCSRIFYKGIAIYNSPKPLAYRYNITSYVSLSEDRTATYPDYLKTDIAAALAQLEDRNLLKSALSANAAYEGDLRYSTTLSEAFRDTVKALGNAAAVPATLAVQLAESSSQTGITQDAEEIPTGISDALSLLRILGFDFEKHPVTITTKISETIATRGDRLYINPKVALSDEEWLTTILQQIMIYRRAWLLSTLVETARARLEALK